MTATTVIGKRIIGYKVITEEATIPKEDKPTLAVSFPKRGLELCSKTYRLKPPQANHALYVTIAYIEHKGKRQLFEIFFNSKDPQHLEWINALTLTLSSAFRTSIEFNMPLTNLINNLKETIGTSGSYLSKVPDKPRFVNGLVAEIGLVIEVFNKECTAWNYSQSSHERPATEEEEQAVAYTTVETPVGDFLPIHASYKVKASNPCPDCGEQLIIMDGCPTCTSCGWSKCA